MATRSERARQAGRRDIERACHSALMARGYQPLRLCWPTYLVLRPHDAPVFLEVLKRSDRIIPAPQRLAFRELVKAGAHIWVWSPDGGFQRILLDPTGRGIQPTEGAYLGWD